MDRHQKWREKNIAQGLCGSCGKRPLKTATYCFTCAKKLTKWYRKHKGAKKSYPVRARTAIPV